MFTCKHTHTHTETQRALCKEKHFPLLLAILQSTASGALHSLSHTIILVAICCDGLCVGFNGKYDILQLITGLLPHKQCG